ncbi:hypothetical protein [Kamptonema sp. UHCC 0994]|uniref:hypothetical protein n=1 Tax=Kamptonema sp. UHCC 0994 TaxID=3031329 RepID=UPI0023B8FB17|nr:hypothetical protein [Kamptonema sp. UHCC 0994]MDF0552825.1 hypothetical protein [Kamptonema sp. UHCC 0994]
MNPALYIDPNSVNESSPLRKILEDLALVETEWEWPYVAYENVDTEIQSGFLSYISIGYFLDRMRYHKLYKTQGFKSFKDYCLKALRKSANYCTKIISAAQVCIELAAAGFEQIPNCVAQALPLVKFNTVREVIDELADLLLDEIEAEPTPITPEKQAEWEADLKALIV